MARHRIRNTFGIMGNELHISLHYGLEAIADASDLQLLKPYQWYAFKAGNKIYAATGGGKEKLILMHRLLCPTLPRVDHKDGNGLNNKRDNLRAATKAQNAWNANKHRDNTSGYKGVTWWEARQCWRAVIMVNGKRMALGQFTTPEAAAQAYDAAAINHFGEFARPNSVA